MIFRTRKRTQRERTLVGQGEMERFAAGRAPCVVVMHGFGGTATDLGPLLDGLSRAGFAYDAALMPGHGTRAELLQEQTFDAWVSAARSRAAAAAKTYGPIVLLGFSLGSLVAMQIASERPPWLAGLVVLGNALTLEAHSAVPLALLSHLRRPLPDLYLVKPQVADLVDKTLLETIVTYDRHPIRAALEVYRAGRRTRDVVGRIVCPTLILHARRDRVCSWHNAQWFCDHVGSRDVRVRIFENSAHVLACDEEREAVAQETLNFLSRL